MGTWGCARTLPMLDDAIRTSIIKTHQRDRDHRERWANADSASTGCASGWLGIRCAGPLRRAALPVTSCPWTHRGTHRWRAPHMSVCIHVFFS